MQLAAGIVDKRSGIDDRSSQRTLNLDRWSGSVL